VKLVSTIIFFLAVHAFKYHVQNHSCMTYKTEFNVAKMDCLSEEQLIRMKLQDFEGIKSLQFDIPNRKLQVYHEGNAEHLLTVLESLNLNTTLIATQEDTTPMTQNNSQHEQKKLLWT